MTENKLQNTLQLFVDIMIHAAKNDFDKLPISQMERVVGRPIPKQLANYGVKDSYINEDSEEYLSFIIEGRAKWLIMQTNKIIAEFLKNDENAS